MKSKRKIWGLLSLSLVIGMMGCSENTDGLERDVDLLKEQIAKLDEEMKGFNNNIESIQKLLNGNKTISESVYDANKGIYILTLSDGTVLKLSEKQDDKSILPQIGINADGFWQVSYDNGETFEVIKVNGEAIQAKGDSSKTPLYRINKNGFWEVSINDGKTYEAVLDEDGEPVKCSIGGAVDSFFTSVGVNDDHLDIVLKDGTNLSIPIVKDFFCYFDKEYEGVQQIPAGESKTYNVNLKGATQVLVTAPAGWTAVLGEVEAQTHLAQLRITAPSLATRATADNTKDVAVLAFAGSFAQLSKIQVEVGGEKTPEIQSPYLFPELKINSHIVLLRSVDPSNAGETGSFWFYRSNKKEDAEIESQGTVSLVKENLNGEDIIAVKLDNRLTGNSFFKVAFGYYKEDANLDINKKYILSYWIKGSAQSKFINVIRNADNSSAFTIDNGDQEPTTTMRTHLIGDDVDNKWTEVTTIFNLKYKAKGVSSIKANNPLQNTTREDVRAVDLRFYPEGVNVFHIANLKLEEYTDK